MNPREPQFQKPTAEDLMQFLDIHERALDRLNYKFLLAANLVYPAGKYLHSIVLRLAKIFTNMHTGLLKHQSTNNIACTIKLAEILLKFKQHVESSGVLSGYEPDPRRAAILKRNFNWIKYFNYVIQNGFDRMRNNLPIKSGIHDLTVLTEAVTNLQNYAYAYLKKYAPEYANKYAAVFSTELPIEHCSRFHYKRPRPIDFDKTNNNKQPANSVTKKAPSA